MISCKHLVVATLLLILSVSLKVTVVVSQLTIIVAPLSSTVASSSTIAAISIHLLITDYFFWNEDVPMTVLLYHY